MTKVIIVGGVAGGASCAARLRRLDEKAEIMMVRADAIAGIAYSLIRVLLLATSSAAKRSADCS